MTHNTVTPEELDAWLRSTDVTEEEEEESATIEPLPIEAAIQNHPPNGKKKKDSWRRRSSLDEENISSRPCFGVDALTILANVTEEVGEQIPLPKNGFHKRSSDSSGTVVASNLGPQSQENEYLAFKKQKIICIARNKEQTQFDRQYSNGSVESQHLPYSRLITDDTYKLDPEAGFSRHSTQFTVPSHTMDQEAQYSRRSSQFSVSRTLDIEAIESFVQAMELSERSRIMLQNHHQFSESVGDAGRYQAMEDSGESRSLLVRLGRRSVAKNRTSNMNDGVAGTNSSCRNNESVNRMNSAASMNSSVNSAESRNSCMTGLNDMYHPTSSSTTNKSTHEDRVASDLRRLEDMLRVEQEKLAGIRSEFS